MDHVIRVIGKIIKWMVLGHNIGNMEKCMKVNILIIKNMEKEG